MKNYSIKHNTIRMVVFLLIFNTMSSIFPIVEEVQAEEETEKSLRVHYETDSIENDLSLWLWGDVASPSDETSEWPHGSLFSEDQTTDYGYYQDVELQEDAEEIGLQVVDANGQEFTEEDIDIPLHEELEEVWISEDGDLYYYEPIEFETPTLRVHYQNEADDYEPLGVWFWGDAPNEPQDWTDDAIPFSNDQVGPYGAYVDIPVDEEANNLGFLIMNRESGDQSEDLSFGEFDQHNQVFVNEEAEEAFTNPFYISEEPEEPEEDHEGEEDIEVNASVNHAFHYDQHALLDVEINNNSELAIDRISADVSALGGTSDLNISPELNRVTLSAHYQTSPGEYTIPISVWDENNGRYETEAVATIIEREKTEDEIDWDEEVIYFMLTDRFADGDPSNNDPYGLNYEDVDNPRGAYQGGDFKGVTENLDYLDGLGINTVWISPIVENVAHDVEYSSDDGSYFGYHGYWASDFEALNPHLGTMEEFHELIDEAAALDIDIMVDVVLNHTGYDLHPDDGTENPPPGYPTDEDRARFEDMIREEPGSDDLTMELAELPDLITEDHSVREQIVDWQSSWVDRSTTEEGNSIASYRVDTVKHVEDTTWQHFKNELVRHDPDFKLIGESWGAGRHDDHGYLNSGMMDSLLDFRYKDTASQFVNGQIEEADAELVERNQTIENHATLGQFLGSHDEAGFLYNHDNNEGKLKLAASLQMTSKGQPVIYYGEELGQSGPDNWPYYENRYDFGWDLIEDNDVLNHYQRVLDFRNEYSELLSRGDRQSFAGSNEEEWLITEREYNDESTYLSFNVAEEEQDITLQVTDENTVITDHYLDEEITPFEYDEDEWAVTLSVPSIEEGGTMLLTEENGELLPTEVDSEEDSEENDEDEPIAETHEPEFEAVEGKVDERIEIINVGDALPEETTVVLGEDSPDGFELTVTEEGELELMLHEEIEAGEYELPVLITYPDGSSAEVMLSVTVIEPEEDDEDDEDEPIAETHDPEFEAVEGEVDERIEIINVGDALPEETTVVLGEDSPDGFELTVTEEGELELMLHEEIEAGEYELSVLITYPDGSTTEILLPVTVTEDGEVISSERVEGEPETEEEPEPEEDVSEVDATTPEEDEDSEEDSGERLPVTATSLWTIGLIGLGSLLIGLGTKVFRKK